MLQILAYLRGSRCPQNVLHVYVQLYEQYKGLPGIDYETNLRHSNDIVESFG